MEYIYKHDVDELLDLKDKEIQSLKKQLEEIYNTKEGLTPYGKVVAENEKLRELCENNMNGYQYHSKFKLWVKGESRLTTDELLNQSK